LPDTKGKRSAQWNKLQPLNELTPNDLDYLYEKAIRRELDPRTLVTNEDNQLIYLLEGEVSLLSGGFVTETFTHLENRALSPLFNESLEEDAALMTSHGIILEVNRELFDGLYSQAQAATMETTETDLSRAEHDLLQSLLQAFMHKKLDLPALPEAAFRIRQAINNPEVGSAEIIQIVQTDPVLSARLVKVANSPLYGTWREIKTVRDAVRRLGLETTKHLSFSLSVKKLFSAHTSMIKDYIHRIYNESIALASIAYVITQQRATHLDPEQALLSGLVTNLGLIPILKYIDGHPSMMQTTEQLGKSLEHLYVPVSTMILEEWNFDPEFVEIVEQAKNWSRDTGKPADYCDVVLAARLLYRQQADDSPVEELRELPVIQKLRLFEIDEHGDFFLDKVRSEVDEMQQLLDSM
jgi:HD-like signal output (HDOD) protein